MRTMVLLLLVGVAVTFANEIWSPEYSEHSQCIARCRPDECPSGCKTDCLCYRRFDHPNNHGYCLDPSKPIPEHFRRLGANN
uniref:Putative secreted protein n=1 Tax=Amblyomma americanum TaxID=6943 RepID=A0A0C9S3A9_AMBAM